MSVLTWLLFESFIGLSLVLGLALFLLLVYWRRSGRGRPLLIGLAVAVVLLAIQALVITKREHADRTLSAIEREIVESRTTSLAEALSPDFHTAGANGLDLDRAEFLAFVDRRLEVIDVRWLDRVTMRIEQSEADRFVVAAAYRAEVTMPRGRSSHLTGWAFTFVRTPEGWKIGDIVLRHIDGVRSPTPAIIDAAR